MVRPPGERSGSRRARPGYAGGIGDLSQTSESRGGPAPARADGFRGVAALVVLTASFAAMTVLARYLSTGFTILQQVYLRAGAAFLLAVVLFRGRIRWRLLARSGRREWSVLVARAALTYPLGTALYSKAATLTTVGAISFIAALPLVSALGLVLRRSAATRRRVAWVLGAAAGVAALSVPGAAAGGRRSGEAAGDLIGLVAMLVIAVFYISRSWHGPIGPGDERLTNPEITVLILGLGALMVAALSLLRGEGVPAGPASGRIWAAVAAAGLLNVVNGYLINFGFEHVEPVRAGNLLTLECLWGLGFGFLFFGQVPGVLELVGGTVIVACAVGLNSEAVPGEGPGP